MQLCGYDIGLDQRLFAIAGPCVIESETMILHVAETLKRIAERLDMLLIFKASFDKANRSSGTSFRGPGMDEGLRILEKVRAETGLPVLTDVHTVDQVAPVAEVADVLQTPAFLARQTDFIAAVAACGKPVNIKKAQFMVTERGATFGYNNLVSDMRSLAIMRETGCPVVFDATHSVQLPGGQGETSGGQREFVPVLAQAAVAVGISGLFMETHPDPDRALSDGPNAWPLDQAEALLTRLLAIDAVVKR